MASRRRGPSKRVELVVQLERWDPSRQYERLGLDDEYHEILGLRVPLIRMPVAPGRNIAILVEVAARNQLLRARGHHAARILAARLDETLRQAASLSAMAAEITEEDEDEEIEGGGPSVTQPSEGGRPGAAATTKPKAAAALSSS